MEKLISEDRNEVDSGQQSIAEVSRSESVDFDHKGGTKCVDMLANEEKRRKEFPNLGWDHGYRIPHWQRKPDGERQQLKCKEKGKQEHKANSEDRKQKENATRQKADHGLWKTSAEIERHQPRTRENEVWVVKSVIVERGVAQNDGGKTLQVNGRCEEKIEFVGVKERGFAIGTCLTKGMKGTNEDEKTRVLAAENEVKREIAAKVEFGGITGTCGGLVVGNDHSGENANDCANLMEKVVAKIEFVKNVEDQEVKFQFVKSVDVFEPLDEVVGRKSLKKEEKDVALSNEDDICEWEMNLWRLVDEKEVRRSRYKKKKKENKHRQIRKNRRHNHKLEMDMNKGLDENKKTQDYTTDTREDEGLRSDREDAEAKLEADLGAAVQDKEICDGEIRKKELEERTTESKEVYVGVTVIKDGGGKERQGKDIAAKELDRGASNNDKKEDLWIQLAAIEKEWKDKLEGVKTSRVPKDSDLYIIATKEEVMAAMHEELSMEEEWLERMLDEEVEYETEMISAVVENIAEIVMQMYVGRELEDLDSFLMFYVWMKGCEEIGEGC
ncbi:hypothetical protein SUGI_0917220 [Cryptomeria japonica]|nr:hypothetical protein SUGI_0917220 [Cryptomeria japonica]